MASYNSSDVTDMIRSKRVFLGTYCPPSSSCGGGGGGNGETGPTGPPGADGKTVLNGVGPPTSAIGTIDDFYLDTSSYVMYGPKYETYYSSWMNMSNSVYIGPNHVSAVIPLPSTNNVVLTVFPVTDMNITFSAYDNTYVVPTLVISNLTAGTPSSTINLNVSHYTLSTANQYQLTYTCATGNTLMDVRFQNYVTASEQVVWTNNPWFMSESLIGPAGVNGATGPVAGSDTQIIYNQSGRAGATGVFAYNYSTGNLTVSGVTTSNVNLFGIKYVTFTTSSQVYSLSFSVPPSSTTVSGAYTYYIFTQSSTITPLLNISDIGYFALGGGGGGGYNVGAGGGAGGLQTNIPTLSGVVTLSQYNAGYLTLSANISYSVTIGYGGLGDTGDPDIGYGSNGGNTLFTGIEFTTITAFGGGGGGSYTGTGPHAGADGGCGGGGSFTVGAGADPPQPDPEPGGLGSQGYSGGSGNTTYFITGGGGGLGGPGGDAGAVSGNGGLAITYLNVSYGGGGGGGAGIVYPPGSGGGGGAGDGSYCAGGQDPPYLPGGDALSNTGSGGGGGGNGGLGGAGGSGIFILGVPTSQTVIITYCSHVVTISYDANVLRMNSSENLVISSVGGIVLNPSGGNVNISGLASNVDGTKILAYNTSSGNVGYSSLLTLSEAGSTLFASSHLIPTICDYYTLGTAAMPWHHLYVGGGTVYIGGIAISSNTGTNTLQFTGSTGGGVGIAGASGVMGPTGPTGLQGATGPIGGTNTQILYNNAGVAAGSVALTFASASGTTTASSLVVTNAASVSGTATFLSNTIMRSALTLNTSNITLGISTGITTQGNNAIAVGAFAGNSNQGSNCIAIGSNAGSSNQSVGTYNCVAVGTQAGQISQAYYSVAIGLQAGQSNQNNQSVAIGAFAGQSNQCNIAVAVGAYAGLSGQSYSTVAVGFNAGSNNQLYYAAAVGSGAGKNNQGAFATAVGTNSGQSNQGSNSIAVGYNAANTSQGSFSVAIGNAAASISQGTTCVAIGSLAGSNTQSAGGIAIGAAAGQVTQGVNSVAIGYVAGYSNLGNYSVAIGYKAGETGQTLNSIAINATGGALNPAVSGFHVAPVRSVSSATGNILSYTTSSEVIQAGIATLGQASVTANLPTTNGIALYSNSYYFDDGNMHIHSKSGSIWINPLDSANVLVGTQSNSGSGGGLVVQANITTNTTGVGHSFFYKKQSGVNVAFDTETKMDNLNCRVHGAGQLQASAVSGSFSAYVSCMDNVAGSSPTMDTNSSGITFTSGSWSSIGASKNIASGGDMIIAHVHDNTNLRIYRVTAIHGSDPAGAYIAIERMG